MANRLSYRYVCPPSYRCDGCGEIHSNESAALECCNSTMTGCGVTEINNQDDLDVDLDTIPCWYLEEAGQLRLF